MPPQLSFTQFVEWAFMGVISGSVIWSARYIGQISKSISHLNEKIGVVIERSEWHEKSLGSLERRVEHLEAK